MVLYLTPEQVVQLHDEEACEGTDLPGVDNYETDTATVADRPSGWAQPLKYDDEQDSVP